MGICNHVVTMSLKMDRMNKNDRLRIRKTTATLPVMAVFLELFFFFQIKKKKTTRAV